VPNGKNDLWPFAILLLPVLLTLLTAILMKLTAPGPVFFRQIRVGYRGKRFMCYKFWTMVVGADSWQAAFQRTTGAPIPPRTLIAAISPQAEEIVLHALQRKPRDR
jgi:hypothetical protein